MLLKDDKTVLKKLLKINSSKLTFDYPFFLRELSCNSINDLVKKWIGSVIDDALWTKHDQKDFCARWFSNNLIRLFMNKSPNVESLVIQSDDYHYNGDFSFDSCTNKGYSALRTLHIDYCCDGHTLRCISSTCHSIEELWVSLIETSNETHPLNELIRSQKAIKDFRLRSVYYNEKVFVITPELLEALSTQKRSLHTVQFFCCKFHQCLTLQPLADCTKLERLGFFNCDSITEENTKPLATGSLQNLNVLAMAVYDGFTEKVIIEIIKNTYRNLKRISLPVATKTNNIRNVFTSMRPFVKNLTGITVCFSAGDSKSFESFLLLLDVCSNLESICIEGGDPAGNPLDFDEKEMSMYFERLAIKMPLSINRLVLYNVSVSPQLLRTFLEKMDSSIRFLGLYGCFMISDAHINEIVKYAKRSGHLMNLTVNWCFMVTDKAIEDALRVINEVHFSDIEPYDMEFTAWLA
ncbi:19104_t:CDS:1 [Racocetra persica]|uniref:19104_t:CDS:1 n=1 Tax=Racocetra persica TaxID=160502 RepID=A0ACA9M6L9_9GLOM|nr:19104_t:CDS:1 [Racocetra persica]